MLALSIWQPWATLIAIGAKVHETRGWPTGLREPIVIHAGKRWEADQVDACYEEPFRKALAAAGIELPKRWHLTPEPFLPLGRAVAVARIVDCVSTDDPAAYRPEVLSRGDLAFGDWSPGRFAFRLADVFRLDPAIPLRGGQRFFRVPNDVQWEAAARVVNNAPGSHPLSRELMGRARS